MQRLLILGLLFFLGSCTQVQSPKGKLVIIGGGSRPQSIIDRIIEESGIRKGGYGIVLPMSSSTPDSSVYWAAEPFLAAGIETLRGLNFVKDEPIVQSRIDSIRNAKLIYITGGDQNRFMEVVAGTAIATAIAEAYQSGSIIAGTSAGAAVMCSVMITGNELKHPEYSSTFYTIESNNLETKPGLGLIENVIIDQHFIQRSRHNRLLTAVIDFPAMLGIGIDEATAILVSGNRVEVLGDSQVIAIQNPSKSRQEKNGKLGGKGLVTSIYLPGEAFELVIVE